MCNPRQELSNAFNTITGWVDRGLTGIGKTFDAIAKDPLPTIATVALTAVGVPPYVTSLARTAMSGGNMENYVIGLATSYAGSQIGAAVGDYAFPELGGVAGYGGAGDLAFQTTATDAILKTVISNASAQGATALLQGKELDQVFNSALTGAVGGLINNALRSELGVDPSKIEGRLISDATKAAVGSILNNQDPALAIGNALSQSVFGTLANTAASGLKSVVSDLNKTATEFETTQSEATTLRGEIDAESARLSGIASILNSESTALNTKQQTLKNSYDLVNLSGQIYDWRSNTIHYNPAANTAYAQRMGLVEGYSEDFGTYYVNPTTNEFVLSLGLHAKDTLEKQAEYLNTNIPQFESDVTNFNTKLATFNTDKTKLDDKVDTYDGYVTKLFGEDGNGGLNKTIQDLLVDRDKYLEDLDKSITGLSEVAGEEISDVAKEIATEAVNTLDQNFRTSDEVADAFANNPLFAGYKPDAADIAKFVGEGADADLQGLINSFVDERTLDAAELADIAQKEGLTLTQDDLLALVQQGDEKELTKQFTERFDKQAVTRDEAKEFFGDYKPSERELGMFTGAGNEEGVKSYIADYADKRSVDYAEARQALISAGYDDPPDEVVKQFVGQSQDRVETIPGRRSGLFRRTAPTQTVIPSDENFEFGTLGRIQSTYDPQFVTREEAQQFFDDIGFEPSDEDLLKFIGKRDESSTFTDIEEFVTGQREADAQKAGFPDYATQQRFEGDVEAYQASLPRADVEPAGTVAPLAPLAPGFGVDELFRLKPSTEPFPYALEENAKEFVTPPVVEPPYTPGEDADEFEPGAGTVVDTLTGGLANDLLGGETDEEREAREAREAEDIIYGGTGNDTATAVVGDETLEGGSGNDTFKSVEGEDTVASGAGNDTVTAGADTDTLTGGAGDDAVFIGTDTETVSGREGNDVVITDPDGSTIILGPDGEVKQITDVDNNVVYDSSTDQETSEGGAKSDFDVDTDAGSLGVGTDAEGTDVGAEGEDTGVGGIGGDVYGYDVDTDASSLSAGTDTEEEAPVAGGDTTDLFFGVDATDTLFGGDQNDTLIGGDETDIVLDDSDTLIGGDENDTLTGENADDTLIGGDENDTLIGGDENDSLVSGDVDDFLTGGDENDTLFGGDENDSLIGGDANDLFVEDELDEQTLLDLIKDDTLFGGDADDTLLGGDENDSLVGGDANDTLGGGEDTQPGFGFEVEGDQTGRGAYTYVDDDGNVLIIEEDGTMYLTDPDGNQIDLGNISTKFPLLKPTPQPPPPVVKPEPVQPQPRPVRPPPKKPQLQGLPAGLNWQQFLAQQAALGPMFQPFIAGAQQPSSQAGAGGPRFEAFYANIPGYKPFDVRQFSSDFYDEE